MSERTNCGRCGGDRFLTSWEDKVRCPECGNADPDDVPAPAAYAPRAEELEYTVQESFVIQPVVPFSGCQGDYSTVDNIPIWDILKYLRRSRDASA